MSKSHKTFQSDQEPLRKTKITEFLDVQFSPTVIHQGSLLGVPCLRLPTSGTLENLSIRGGNSATGDINNSIKPLSTYAALDLLRLSGKVPPQNLMDELDRRLVLRRKTMTPAQYAILEELENYALEDPSIPQEAKNEMGVWELFGFSKFTRESGIADQLGEGWGGKVLDEEALLYYDDDVYFSMIDRSITRVLLEY